MVTRPIIAVIGKGDLVEGDAAYDLAFDIGRSIIDHGMRLSTGGLGGVMEAASRGARSSKDWKDGDIIGILPGTSPDDANDFVDIPIPTGIGIGRNMVLTNADGIIAVGGGSGTLSEMAFSWQKGRPIVAMNISGWSGELAGKPLDDRHGGLVIHKADDADEAVETIKRLLDPDGQG